MTFSEFQLLQPILRAVSEEGYDTPTPIQQAAIPHVLAGADLLGCAQTGTGKTAAFALPLLQRLLQKPVSSTGRRPIRTLVLAPTRELATQIDESFRTYGRHCGLRTAVIFGGVTQGRQVSALMNGVDIVIATPGRLLDLMNQGFVNLSQLHHLVLDEADNMLDMGFIHDIRKVIAKVPPKRQTLLFSATMPHEIRQLANSILTSPMEVKVAPVSSAAETVDQWVYHVNKADKPAMLVHYLNSNNIERVLVFSRTKHGADRIAKVLVRSGITAQAIHGNKSQNARTKAMASFKSSAPPVLVATDIAARGLDIDEVSHVINYDLPNVPETYVHRIGRTGRAGASGIAISFCDREERTYLRDIEKLMKRQVQVAEPPATLPQPKIVAPPHHPSPSPSDRRHEPQQQVQHKHPLRHQPTKPHAHPQRGGGQQRQQHQGGFGGQRQQPQGRPPQRPQGPSGRPQQSHATPAPAHQQRHSHPTGQQQQRGGQHTPQQQRHPAPAHHPHYAPGSGVRPKSANRPQRAVHPLHKPSGRR